MPNICPICEGMGMRTIMRAGIRYAEPCECRHKLRGPSLFKRARIPARYDDCDLENYETEFKDADPSLKAAKLMASNFVTEYPVGTECKGLLITGPVGVGKTHLAIGILRGLIEKGVPGLFWDYRELLKEIQHSYESQVDTTELGILRPVFDAEVLVLDELGAQKPTDWVWDKVALILNARYSKGLTTIVTTNFEDKAPALEGADTWAISRRAVRNESLQDRIGDLMLSRLLEMCVEVKILGQDFRRTVKRAQFSGYTRLI